MPVTYGPAGTPNQLTVNLDAVFATSLANYQRTLVDNISKSNAFFYELTKRKLWKGIDGGAHIDIPLMYALATPDSYSGYDALSTQPTDGITQAIFDWAQAAVPVSISGLEEIRNRQKIVSLIESKIVQSEMGIKEWFTKAFLQGSLLSGGASLSTPYVSPNNGSSFINPLFLLVNYDTTPTGDQADAAVTVGGIANSNTWWRNWCINSAATTYTGLLLEFDKMYDLCSRGPGGPPKLIWVDETTKRLINAAYYINYRSNLAVDGNYPFDNLMFRGAHIVSDEFMPDVEGTLTNTDTKGTAVFIHPDFLQIKYDNQTNFVSGSFKVPINQDARTKQILWAGQSCVSNRRKHGVIGDIARTLTA